MDRIDAALTSRVIVERRRKWLSLLLETGNEKVASAYQKYDQLHKTNVEAANKGNSATMPKSGAIGPVKPITTEKLSAMSNIEIAAYLESYAEKDIGMPVLEGRGLADTLAECVAASPQQFTDDLLPFQKVRNLYQSSLLQGCLNAWRNQKDFNWAALLEFIHHILLSEQFWTEQYNDGFNYRNWVLSGAADLIAEGTKDDTYAFDEKLLPLAEEILLVIVDRAQRSVSTLDNLPTDVLNSDGGRTFSAMVNYALRFARVNASEYTDCRWPYAIRADFTKRLDRSVEPSFEFSYTLGFHLLYLSYLDKEWVYFNINRIFPQQNEDHWQAAFSGYLLPLGVHEEFYALLKAHGHYRKALNTHFADTEVVGGLVNHICTGWIEDSETLNDKASLIYQLIHSGNPNLLSAMVYFFSRRADNLSEKVKVKVIPAWRALFEVFSQHSNETAYQSVSASLLGWIGLIDKIDAEVLSWVNAAIGDVGKTLGYGLTLSRVIKALRRHALKTPEMVGEIYLKIPQRIIRNLQSEADDIVETIRILYNEGQKESADNICYYFVESGLEFLRPIYEEYQRR